MESWWAIYHRERFTKIIDLCVVTDNIKKPKFFFPQEQLSFFPDMLYISVYISIGQKVIGLIFFVIIKFQRMWNLNTQTSFYPSDSPHTLPSPFPTDRQTDRLNILFTRRNGNNRQCYHYNTAELTLKSRWNWPRETR